MCGIVAIFGKDSGSIAETALSKIRHRGFDGIKLLSFPNLTLGFNRLAINDKSERAMQPFEYGIFVGVFNGEIFNSDELKNEFDIKTFSNSDTEVILPLFEKLGIAVIHHLDGFYSGVILNKQTNQVFTIRDYIGKKPLFYGKSDGFEFLTSELKSVKKINDFEIIPKGFSEIINKKIKLIKEHEIPFASKNDLKAILIDAVKKRIPKKENKFGVFLSGGLDSSIIASLVSKDSNNVIYYTLGNENSADLQFVKSLSKKLYIKIKIIPLPELNELPELIRRIVYHTESFNPSIISNGLATYLLSKAAHDDGIKVVLTGEGADELFCGYSISENANERFEKRIELIQNMHYTELRRLDLASMANTLEIRCPFLDRKVFSASNECKLEDLIQTKENLIQGKKILRELFYNNLPMSISERKKVSFDVGSGIRKMVVKYLTKSNHSEKESLKRIWLDYFQENLSNNNYFHSYPSFDKAIENRGETHK